MVADNFYNNKCSTFGQNNTARELWDKNKNIDIFCFSALSLSQLTMSILI
jgi:hypothetical protein